MSLSSNQPQIDRDDLVHILRQWGGVSAGGILDANCLLFTDPLIPGLIGYRLAGNNAVVLGDPVCAPENKALLALAFQQFCSTQNLGVVYIITTEAFAFWAEHHLSSILIEFGITLTLNPSDHPSMQPGLQFKPLRKKIHNCLHKGVIVKEYKGSDESIEVGIKTIVSTWQSARKGPQIHLCHPTPFNDRVGKRWFYAELNGKIIGSLILNELKQDKSWLLNNVMICQNSPNGLSELLVVSALDVLDNEGCTSVTIGPVPRKKLGKIIGVNPIILLVTQWIYRASKTFFNLGGHEAFWEKFQPHQQGSYLVFPNKSLGYSSIRAIIKSLHNE